MNIPKTKSFILTKNPSYLTCHSDQQLNKIHIKTTKQMNLVVKNLLISKIF